LDQNVPDLEKTAIGNTLLLSKIPCIMIIAFYILKRTPRNISPWYYLYILAKL